MISYLLQSASSMAPDCLRVIGVVCMWLAFGDLRPFRLTRLSHIGTALASFSSPGKGSSTAWVLKNFLNNNNCYCFFHDFAQTLHQKIKYIHQEDFQKQVFFFKEKFIKHMWLWLIFSTLKSSLRSYSFLKKDI